MELISLEFFIFVILVLGIYFIVPKKIKWIVLLLSSFVFLFYDNFNITTILEALIILITSYVCGIFIDRNLNNGKSRRYLIIGIIIIIGMLIYLKYSNLFLITLNHIFNLFNINYNFSLVERNSLIGTSYYSLIMIGYLTDIYRGTCKAEKNIFKCALFMSYFPILTSGPFIRYNDIKEDLYDGHKFDYNRLCFGLLRILIGIFKILVISERIANFVNTVYGNLSSFGSCYIIISVLLFPLQLYTNFSGSIDIIIGISTILGIKLPENFRTPFFSKTLTEFWRRWHITLGLWLKEYIFYPLLKSDFMQNINKKYKDKFGKKIAKKIPLYLSMLVMWIFIGVWHGGSYNYILGSGIIQFVIIFLEDVLEPVTIKITKKMGINREGFAYKTYQIIRTYLLFSFAMIFFRASSVSNALQIIKSIFNGGVTITPIYTLASLDNILELFVFICAIISLFIIEFINRKECICSKILKHKIIVRWIIIYILIFSVIIFGCYGTGYDPTTFIYGGF